ncbi:MAG: helix-turn-helix domain-containing protein, partial [Desulforhopalus sp.]|nr:helix-turn-helix domain-containing protein [Desulforhopalus sp.]
LPAHIAGGRREKVRLATLQEITAQAEKQHIGRILQLTQGNRSRAAEILGVSRKTLWEKINTLELEG